MISLTDISFSYQVEGPLTLSALSLTVPPGQWLAVVGANGSGKSTLARCINGLLQPQQGSVVVDGYSTATEAELLSVRQRVAFVFQNPDNQLVATSVEDDVAFGPENLGLPRQEITERVERALEIVNLTQKRHLAPHLLSGGEKQRVALAGAIAMASRYLVLDEPTSMLDPLLCKQVLDCLQLLHREYGMGIVYVTNIMQEALLAERVLVLDKGRIVKDDSPAAVFADAAFLEQHGLALPAVSRISAALAEAGIGEAAGATTIEALVEKLCS